MKKTAGVPHLDDQSFLPRYTEQAKYLLGDRFLSTNGTRHNLCEEWVFRLSSCSILCNALRSMQSGLSIRHVVFLLNVRTLEVHVHCIQDYQVTRHSEPWQDSQRVPALASGSASSDSDWIGFLGLVTLASASMVTST